MRRVIGGSFSVNGSRVVRKDNLKKILPYVLLYIFLNHICVLVLNKTVHNPDCVTTLTRATLTSVNTGSTQTAVTTLTTRATITTGIIVISSGEIVVVSR